MTGFPPAAAFAALVLAVLSENLFGRELNGFFLLLPGIDKVLHAAAYAAVFLTTFWLTGRVARHSRRRAAVTCVAGVTLALLDEFTQRFISGRNFEAFDLAANMAGLTVGWVVAVRPRLPLAIAAAAAALATVAYAAHDTHARLSDYAKALQHERRHEFTEARESYLRALAAGMRGPSIYNELAWVSIEGRAGTAEEALRYARLAYDAEPENADILDTYGWALHYAGRSREALPYLEAAFARKPDMFCIHYHLGEVYAALSRFERAAEHFRQQMALRGTREARLAEEALVRLNAGSGNAPRTPPAGR